MKKQFTRATTLILAALTLTFVACKKKEKEEETPVAVTAATPTATTPPAATGFTWTENGGAAITADSAFWTTGTWGTGIRAYKGAGHANFFEINWASQNNTSVGVKTLNVGYDFTFIKGSNTYTNPASQTLNVTAFANNKLSGNTTVAVTGGSITTLVCTFNDLPKK